MIFTQEETGFEKSYILKTEKASHVELHNFGLITEHNLSKFREGGLKLFISQKIIEKEIQQPRVKERPVIQKLKKILETKLLELYLFCKPP